MHQSVSVPSFQYVHTPPYLVPLYFTLGIIFKVAVPLEPALYQLSELGRKRRLVEQMVNPHAASGSFRRVRRTNALLRCSNTLAPEFYLLQPIDDLVKVKNDVRSVRDEQPAGAIEPYEAA